MPSEKRYTYAQFRKKFMPRCLKHCFCRKGLSDKGWYRKYLEGQVNV